MTFPSLLRPILFAVAAALTLPAAETYVSFRPSLPAGAACYIPVRQLHPTQYSLGFREVAYKTKAIDNKTAPELLEYLKDKDVPIVIGPGGVPYMTDGHHTMRALLESRWPDKLAYGHILADWSNLDEATFWARMREKRYTYLKDENGRGPLHPADLPASLGEMHRDAYRGLAWAVMKAGGFEEKKGPDVFFQEFYWADYFRDKVRWNDANEADFQRALKQALALAHAPGASGLPGFKPR